MANIAIYVNDPYCSWDSASGFVDAMDHFHQCSYINDINLIDLQQYHMVVFPGGIGDADSFDWLLADKANLISHYVMNGGMYLGICMGAYWAGPSYFDLIDSLDTVQYIKQPNALVKRSYGTVVPVTWENNTEFMYFYDGCTFEGDTSNVQVVGQYGSGHPAAIIQENNYSKKYAKKVGKVGLIGPHLESTEYWYNTWSYMPDYWHQGKHHQLLRKFVNEMLTQ